MLSSILFLINNLFHQLVLHAAYRLKIILAVGAQQKRSPDSNQVHLK